MKRSVLTIILAILGGEIALVLLTTVAQEVIFDGIKYYSSSAFDLVFGGLATVLAAVLAGAIMRIISKQRSIVPALIVSLLITLEMTWLLTSKATGDPVWFDVLAGLSLVMGIWVGYYGMNQVKVKSSA